MEQNKNNLDVKKVEKVAKVNFSNGKIFEILIDKNIYKLDSIKNFMNDIQATPNTEKVETFVQLVNNLIFNETLNEKISLFSSAKNNFNEKVRTHSINFFKNIMNKAYMTSYNNLSLKIEKETHTETTCDKKQVEKISTAKYFQTILLNILTDNGKDTIRYDSIKNEFSILKNEIVEDIND